MQDPPTPLSELRGDTPLPGHCAPGLSLCQLGVRSAVGKDLAAPRGGDTRQGQEAGVWESRGAVGLVQNPLVCALGVELAALGSPDSRPGWRLAPGSPGCPRDAGRPPLSCLRQRAWVWAPPAQSWAFSPWKLCHPPIIRPGTVAGLSLETLTHEVTRWPCTFTHGCPMTADVWVCPPRQLRALGPAGDRPATAHTDGRWPTRARGQVSCSTWWLRAGKDLWGQRRLRVT